MSENKGYSRRDFLKIVGATGGIAAVGCTQQPVEKIIPYLNQPDDVVPGVAVWYSGSCAECSAGCGTLVRTREGRVVKVEGNPLHPVNSGGLCTHGQAAVQALYDPDRIRQPLIRKAKGSFEVASWAEAMNKVSSAMSQRPAGSEVVLLTNPLSGSTAALVDEFVKSVPQTEHLQFELFGRDVLNIAAEKCFGTGYRVNYDFSKAKMIVSFGADFLETWISPVQFARDWAAGRSPAEMSYFVHVEPRLSATAANADKWLMNAPGSEMLLLTGLLKLVFESTGGKTLTSAEKADVAGFVKNVDLARVAQVSGLDQKNLQHLADRLVQARSSLVIAGGASMSGSDAVSGAVLSIVLNKMLGNIGGTVNITKTAKAHKPVYPTLQAMLKKINADPKKIAAVIISGSNPAFMLPEQSGFRQTLSKVPFIVSVSAHLDETALMANVVLPLSTQFEAWNDAEPALGVYNLNQPAMQPLYQTQSLGDSLIALGATLNVPFNGATSFYDYLRLRWKERIGEADFEAKWRKFVEDGGDLQNGSKEFLTPELISGTLSEVSVTTAAKPKLSLLAYPSVSSFDGRAANKPWMQELPNPITTAIWGSWVEVHPQTAEAQHLSEGTVVRVETANGVVEAPLYLNKHIHPSLIAIPIGQGHEAYGRYAAGVGQNPLAILQFTEGGGIEYLTEVRALNTAPWKDELVTTQGHDYQYQRGLLRKIGVAAFGKLAHDQGKHSGDEGEKIEEDPLALGPHESKFQMYRQMDHPLYRWAMSIDLASCTGCSACVVACYAENNVPVVGRDLCAKGREMSWLRIERYFDEDDRDQPTAGFLPMMCQQCGNAPCESVCPVYATYHTEEGLNAQVYNRCVGTRYCSNNCPYKVRRFNWFTYKFPDPLTWQLNPDVTVREVGTMEKCTFCVQRIREGKNKAKNLGRVAEDGEVVPACASSCPTKAITFGNLLDKKSRVYQESQSERGYKVLDSVVNTQPAVTYLARVRNDTAKVS